MNDKTFSNTNNAKPTAGATGSHTMDRISKSVHKGIDSASEAAHPTIDRAAASAHRAVDNADGMANQAAEALDRAGVKGDELITASTTYMRDHPIITIGAAVAAGYMLSRLLAAR